MNDITCQQGQQIEIKKELQPHDVLLPVSQNIVLEGWRGNRIKEVKGSANAVESTG